MHLSLVTFRFRSEDFVAEEHNYFATHVRLTRALPGLALYLTGRLRATARLAPVRQRGALIGFADAAASGRVLRGEADEALRQDTRAHMTDLRAETMVAETIVPFPAARGRACFTVVATFDLAAAVDEARYREQLVGTARRLPGLRGYFIGPLLAPAGRRMAALCFDDYAAMRAAYRSPLGAVVRRSAAELLAGTLVCYIEGQVEHALP